MRIADKAKGREVCDFSALERAKLRFEPTFSVPVGTVWIKVLFLITLWTMRAVTEALVNAFIHRDYLVMGSEVHTDMYDDRLEIYSPGGMYRGKPIQEYDLDEIDSVRRNPVIAALFHRIKFMERRGSGIKKIYSSFFVTLKNVNYSSQSLTDQDTGQVVAKMILKFCEVAKSIQWVLLR